MPVAAGFPFCALVGQEQLKLCLTLAAIDWRVSCLILGEKGSGKSTAARGLAEILPGNPPFLNVPIGVTEDRLLGGISLDAAFQGSAVVKPGLIESADGGVLYIDEVNLLAGPLTDALLDVSATGRFVLERDGFSQENRAYFVLLGSMNPEEGNLRPQLADRFALAVDVHTPASAAERVAILKVREEYDRDPSGFRKSFEQPLSELRRRIASARERLQNVRIPEGLLLSISERIAAAGVRSLRADLAVARAASALAAFEERSSVEEKDVDAVLPLALLHRTAMRSRAPQPPPPSPPQPSPPQPEANGSSSVSSPASNKIFPPESRSAPTLRRTDAPQAMERIGPQVDVFQSLQSSVRNTGSVALQPEFIIHRDTKPAQGTRFVFVVDCSGSQAARQRMRAVKGVALALLGQSVQARDEVAVIVFRGARAEILVEPTSDINLVERRLELVPTGGRTPLAHALELAAGLTDHRSCVVLLTDGKANVALGDGDPWQQALDAATGIRCPALVLDTSLDGATRLRELARAFRADLHRLDTLDETAVISLLRR